MEQLDINPENYTEKQQIVIRRLQRAFSEQKVRETMDLEDEILEEFDNLEREIEMAKKELGKTQKELEKSKIKLKTKDKELEEYKKMVAELIKKLDKK